MENLKNYIDELRSRQRLMDKVLQKCENPIRYIELSNSYMVVNKIISELEELNIEV